MRFIVSTHQGKLYDDEVDYIVCKNEDGEFAILKNHVPIICAIPTGYIKLVLGKQELYVALNNAMLEFKDNVCNLIAQGAFIGQTKESAREHLNSFINDRLIQNHKQDMDYTKMEKDLRDTLKKAKAGNV